MLTPLLVPMLAVIGLSVVVWSAIVLANKAADRNAHVFERYVQMRVDQTLDQAFAHLDDEDDEPEPSPEPSGEEGSGR